MTAAEGPDRVLVIDDDDAVRLLVVHVLSGGRYVVDEAGDAFAAMERFGANRPDLVLLDVMLPAVDGFDLLARIRKDSDVPVILLTALGSESERIRGLRLGADDYVVKPFSPGELVARIESVLRRARAAPSGSRAGPTDARLRFAGLEIDRATREVSLDGKLVSLTNKEFDLLAFLAGSPRQVFSREQLLHQVWQSSVDWQDDATVTEHVRRIRHKIEAKPDEPRWVVTVRGAGYRFQP